MEYYFQSNSVKNILKCPKANLATHCLAEFFPIYQNKHWTIRWQDDHTVVLSSHRIILKIVGFHISIIKQDLAEKGPKVDQWPTLMLLLSVQDENQEAIGFRMDKGEMENGKIMDFRKWRLETIHQPEGNRKEGQIFSS